MDALLNNRLSIANLPTPIHYYPRLSERCGIQLFVKRDDLTESVASGNKIRKLEYVLFDAMAQGADTLVSCGGIQSNHCRAVAWIAAKMGLDCVLLLRGNPKGTAQGNLLMDRVLGAQVRFFSRMEFKNIVAIQKQVCSELREKGKKPYSIPMGASNATGSLGYVNMVKEHVEARQQFDHIYCALGSGGTLAGIILGCRHFNVTANIKGIAVCDNVAYFAQELSRIQQEFLEKYALSADLSNADTYMDDRYVGIGYALNTEEELHALIKYAQTEGLVLDPVYTLKAFIGMMDHIKKGVIKSGEKVLFVHSGGHYGLFAKSNEIEGAL